MDLEADAAGNKIEESSVHESMNKDRHEEKKASYFIAVCSVAQTQKSSNSLSRIKPFSIFQVLGVTAISFKSFKVSLCNLLKLAGLSQEISH